jgi:hypothetical protein
LFVAASTLLAACQPPSAGVLPSGAVPDADMTLQVSNETTVLLALVVNGKVIGPVQPGAQLEFRSTDLRPLPWAAEVRLGTGRAVVSLTVRSGDVQIQRDSSGGITSEKSDGARADLSCGRIDLWSGAPLLGPARGPGTPGDCD